ncbi:MAG TPA: sulfotransferase domain-containing protein [Streptosporangiaceae bacterium]|nr:sulfotransferase domain-containing protein [Streptosporangiaceae bacterium]
MASDDFRVVYLGGMGRSGSTLAERLLGELPGVCVAGEIVHLWQRGVADNERCGCGTEFRACEFWCDVAEHAFGGWANVDVGRITELRGSVDRTRYIPMLAGPSVSSSLRRDLAEYTSYYKRLYRAIAQVSGCQVVVDSSKHASLAFCLRRCSAVDLRVLHVVRDSRAVAYSWTTRVRRPEASDDSESGYMTRYSPLKAAREWNTQNGALQLLGSLAGGGRTPVLRLRYEDLVRSVKPALREIARFAGFAVGETGLSFVGGSGQEQWAELSRTHTAAGNPMRFTTGKISIRADDRWQEAMPPAQRRTVTALTLPLLWHYGYARARDSVRNSAGQRVP